MRTVLVTGASGSFGNAFVARLLHDGMANKIIVFSRDEYKHGIMRQRFNDNPRLRFLLGDVRDRERLRIALHGVDTVVHAAALKQVPAGEYDPSEFIKTNILGTENVLLASRESATVQKVLVLSSDKAAAPLTLYGSTKSVAEHLTRAAQHYSTDGCKFACLRYGNVAGSRGSVIPVWRKMIADGVTELPVTDERMTRFFFTINDAVDFALWTLGNMQGGDLYVPKMPSFYITDLAKAMGAKYRVVGIRSAEKLAEVMVTDDEASYFQTDGKYFIRAIGLGGNSKLPDGFSYRSDTNSDWLNVDGLRHLLEIVP